MQDRKYLLSIEECLDGDNAGRLLEAAFSKVDSERYEKAKNLKHCKVQAASLGAGLLLQLAVKEAVQARKGSQGQTFYTGSPNCGTTDDNYNQGSYGNKVQDITGKNIENADGTFACYTVSRLLEKIQQPMPLAYKYGKNGKPYLQGYPFYFNLSHSGSYVLCVLSMQEIGADIQQHRTGDIKRLTQRFFSPQEVAALEACRQSPNKLFYRLWARKEAYGKLTGGGIADTIGKNLLPDPESLPDQDGISSQSTGIIWEEYEIPGYSMAVCKGCDLGQQQNQIARQLFSDSSLAHCSRE